MTKKELNILLENYRTNLKMYRATNREYYNEICENLRVLFYQLNINDEQILDIYNDVTVPDPELHLMYDEVSRIISKYHQNYKNFKYNIDILEKKIEFFDGILPSDEQMNLNRLYNMIKERERSNKCITEKLESTIQAMVK